jgi:predicted dehydrogenase
MKILLIGAGRWGKNHLKTWKKLGVDLCVADSDKEALESIKNEVPTSLDYPKFLDKVDAVDIVTGADSHLAICRDALKAGKDVFIEKPLAMNLAEAEMMTSQKSIIQVGHIYRYHTAVTVMKQLIDEGRIGRIDYAYGHFMGRKRPRMDVGVTQTDAIHYFDLFNYLFGGTPRAVTAVVKHHLGLPLDDTSICILDYGGSEVLIEAGYLAPHTKRDIMIVGNKASIYCDFKEGHLDLEGVIIPYSSSEPLFLELKDFLNSIQTRAKPLADWWAGYQALRIVEACYESSQSGRKVELL